LKQTYLFEQDSLFLRWIGIKILNRKNLLNMTVYEEDFGVPAEWHFFAVLNGKSACDVLAGRVNRLAARASLQQPCTDQIMTPRQLFNWAETNIQNVIFSLLLN
jgi:hypothetical protein